MKFVRFLGVLLLLIPCVSIAADTSEFQNASRLLTAARRGDIQTVQFLINNGVDVNYVDSTGMSLVCTAVMNNDTRAIQVLQMYGADASQCDRQIKQYKQKTKVAAKGEEYGFFSGLSSTHIIALSAVGVAAVVGGVVLLAKVFDKDNDNGSSGSSGDRPNNNNGGNTTTETTKLFAQNLPYGPACSGTTCPDDFSLWEDDNQDFTYMSANGFNYLMVSHAYDAFVRGYLGMRTIRITSDLAPFDLSSLPYTNVPGGGKPVNVAMITGNGVNATGSAVDGLIPWVDSAKIASVQSICAQNGSESTECQNALAAATNVAHKFFNYTGTSAGTDENDAFDLSGAGTVFGSATDADAKLTKIIAGWEEGGRSSGDYYGFIPNGQLTVYRTGNGQSWNSGTSEWDVADYKNYAAINDALRLQSSSSFVVNAIANLSLPVGASNLGYATVDTAKVLDYAASTTTLKKAVYSGLIDNYYNLNTADDTTTYTMPSGVIASGKQSDNAAAAFTYMENYRDSSTVKVPLLINPAGHSLFNALLYPMTATFENFAPVVYNGLENIFMTVVAVQPADGTSGDSISGYSASGSGKLELSTWEDANDSSINYSSRMCGLAGTGNGGAMNPWCFAAPGVTDLDATAAMAGSVALVQSAFDYMTPKQVFLLLALTADGPYLGTNPETNLAWTSDSVLIEYLKTMYSLPSNLDSSDAQYLNSFKNAFGYGMINLERATRPTTNVYFYSSDTNTIVSGSNKAYWRNATTTTSRASSVLSLANRGAIKTSFFDVIESSDGSISLPRVWNTNFSETGNSKHGLYMGDVLADFNVDATNKHTNQVGNISFDMAMSPRAYNDNLNGLDNLRVAFTNEKYDMSADYQRYLTDGESRFSGRANGVLSLVTNSVATGARYKYGNFAFGGRAFSGTITDESLLENDPVVSAQFEPGRLGLANGAAMDTEYATDKFKFNVAIGNLHETNTVLGMYSDGILTMRGGDTQYVDVVTEYKPFTNVKLSARGTFANTTVDTIGGLISDVSDIKSNAFALEVDVGGFDFTASMPLATVGGKVGYDYAEFDVVENNGNYEIAMNNPHVEYIDLAKQKRELRFSSSYKQSIGQWTDAGVGFIYRVNPNNTDAFGNESIFMFKLHHRLGI